MVKSNGWYQKIPLRSSLNRTELFWKVIPEAHPLPHDLLLLSCGRPGGHSGYVILSALFCGTQVPQPVESAPEKRLLGRWSSDSHFNITNTNEC